MNKPAPSTKPDPSFEASLERLERIVAEMEGGELGLDAMLQHFEEGTRLVKTCSARLEEVERRVEMLVKKAGEETLVPFEEDSASDS